MCRNMVTKKRVEVSRLTRVETVNEQAWQVRI